MRRQLLVLSLLLALPLQAASAADAETLRWKNPWKVGQVLEYDTEALETEDKAGRREKTRNTDATTIRIIQATEDGFVQEWRSREAHYEVLEGDQAEGEMVRAAMKALEDVAIEAALDKDGNYGGIRNLEAVSGRMRTAMRPIMLGALETEFARHPGKVDDKARDEAAKAVEGMVERITSPAVVAAMLGRVVETYNAFVGVELESGQWYELDTELDNPMGGAKFPAKLEFALYPSESDPGDVFFEWTSTIDPVKGGPLLWDMAEKLIGMKVPADARKKIQVSIRDEGFSLFRGDTGVTEMFETERQTKVGDYAKVERHRMRLLGSDHDHAWKDDDAGEADTGAEATADADADAEPQGQADAGNGAAAAPQPGKAG